MDLVTHVSECIDKANQFKSKLDPEICGIQSWTSPKIQHLLNNLCSRGKTNYLEIGVWKGATHIAALYQNNAQSIAIDNFSEHWDKTGYPFEVDDEHNEELKDFQSNCQRFLNRIPTVIDADFRTAVDLLEDNKYNVYFYDGGHKVKEQQDGIVKFWPKLKNQSVIIIDDWNWESVSTGAKLGLEAVKAKVIRSWELPANMVGDRDEWWNGVAVFVVKKR